MTDRRVFGWHTQIPGCAHYRVQLPLRTLGQQRGWHTRFGQQLPLTWVWHHWLADDGQPGNTSGRADRW